MRLKNRDSRIDALRNVPLFTHMAKKDLDTLARHTDVVDGESGMVLCTEGKQGHQLFVIASGAAKVVRNKRKLATLGPGDVIGELSLLDGQPASATVTLTEDSHLLVMSPQDFSTVLAESPGFQTKLLKALAGRLRDADKRHVG